jgi:hypothetical protein
VKAKSRAGGLIKMAPSTNPRIFVSEAGKGLTREKHFSFSNLEGRQPILAKGILNQRQVV